MKIFNSLAEILAEIPNKYKAVILDIWGVLHSSGKPFPNTLNALKTLKENGTRVILLSNAPRRASAVSKFLEETVGIPSIYYDKILTSGEAFYSYISSQMNKTAFYIGPEKDLTVLEGLSINVTKNIEDNFDFCIITGISENAEQSLQKLKDKNTKMFCLNPDIFIVQGDGKREECAGFLAQKYQAIGGEVVYFGKPYLEVYTQVLQYLSGFEKHEILAVGDGMETDILGAKNAGIPSCLCLSGLPSLNLKTQTLEEFLQKETVKPDLIIKAL